MIYQKSPVSSRQDFHRCSPLLQSSETEYASHLQTHTPTQTLLTTDPFRSLSILTHQGEPPIFRIKPKKTNGRTDSEGRCKVLVSIATLRQQQQPWAPKREEEKETGEEWMARLYRYRLEQTER